jgi:hypothetical protein
VAVHVNPFSKFEKFTCDDGGVYYACDGAFFVEFLYSRNHHFPGKKPDFRNLSSHSGHLVDFLLCHSGILKLFHSKEIR